MIYQLVLITNLGIITPLATFTDRIACINEMAFIQKSQQYSAACLPTNSPDQVMKQSQESMRQMMDMLRQLAQEPREKK